MNWLPRLLLGVLVLILTLFAECVSSLVHVLDSTAYHLFHFTETHFPDDDES